MRLQYLSFVLVTGVVLQCTNVHANPWQDIAKADFDFIKKTIEENHPGYVDPDNPQFKIQLEQNYRNVIGQLKYVQSLDAVLNLDHEFIAGFADVHLAAEFRFNNGWLAWAGMKIERRQDKYLVTKVATGWPVALAPVGSQLISCDGRVVDEIMNYDILRYRYANYQDNYPRIMFASKLLIDDGVGYRKRASSCVFKDVNGKEISLPMMWQPLGDHASYEWDAQYPKPDMFSITQLDSSIVWVRVPTLMPTGDNPQQLKALVQSLANMHLGVDKVVVFDVRGNGGGSSIYGRELIQAAMGHIDDANAEYIMVENNHGARYRASSYNLDYIKAQSANSNVTDHALVDKIYHELIVTLQQSIEKHQPLAEFRWSIAKPDSHMETGLTHTTPKLVILTSHFCASSCLDFVQGVLSQPGAMQIGEETSADSRYNEPNFFNGIELPSKLGTFRFPLKILEPRGPYQPSIKYDGDLNDTDAVKQWVRNLPQLH